VTLLPQEAEKLWEVIVNPEIYRRASQAQGGKEKREGSIGLLMQNLVQVRQLVPSSVESSHIIKQTNTLWIWYQPFGSTVCMLGHPSPLR
jgi:hypothetical protein